VLIALSISRQDGFNERGFGQYLSQSTTIALPDVPTQEKSSSPSCGISTPCVVPVLPYIVTIEDSMF
jgi:hypothetical protein